MKNEYNRLMLIAIADAVIALILSAIVLVMILTTDFSKPQQIDAAPETQNSQITPPTNAPTREPTAAPTQSPTATPEIPTSAPQQTTSDPTQSPDVSPSASPTATAVPQVTPGEVPKLDVAQGIDVTYLDKIETGKVTGDGVHLREKPDSQSKSLKSYNKDDQVSVYGSTGRWYLVKIGDLEGFMSKTYVSLN